MKATPIHFSTHSLSKTVSPKWWFMLAIILLTSCYNSPRQTILLDYAEENDSNAFPLARPYRIGDNFMVQDDSLLLAEERPMHWSEGVSANSDSFQLYRDDRVVVAAVTIIPEDSIDSVWVKVARDQFTMGWVHEGSLMEATVPDDPISAFIILFSSQHTLWFLLMVSAVCITLLIHLVRRKHFKMVHVDDIPSAYPTLLTTALNFSALVYAYIQHYHTTEWVQFYFHPTLNPLAQPPSLCVFLFSVWMLPLLTLAAVDDAFSLLKPPEAVLYLFSLLGVCIIIYLVVALTSPWLWLGTLISLAYVAFAWQRYFRYARARYRCGSCGRKLRQLGICPHCGAFNE